MKKIGLALSGGGYRAQLDDYIESEVTEIVFNIPEMPVFINPQVKYFHFIGIAIVFLLNLHIMKFKNRLISPAP